MGSRWNSPWVSGSLAGIPRGVAESLRDSPGISRGSPGSLLGISGKFPGNVWGGLQEFPRMSRGSPGISREYQGSRWESPEVSGNHPGIYPNSLCGGSPGNPRGVARSFRESPKNIHGMSSEFPAISRESPGIFRGNHQECSWNRQESPGEFPGNLPGAARSFWESPGIFRDMPRAVSRNHRVARNILDCLGISKESPGWHPSERKVLNMEWCPWHWLPSHHTRHRPHPIPHPFVESRSWPIRFPWDFE